MTDFRDVPTAALLATAEDVARYCYERTGTKLALELARRLREAIASHPSPALTDEGDTSAPSDAEGKALRAGIEFWLESIATQPDDDLVRAGDVRAELMRLLLEANDARP